MDAPPDKEPLTSYIDITEILLENNLRVPQIYKIDKKNGFLLLEDFGKKPLLSVLKGSNYDEYYNAAIKTVIKLQKINKILLYWFLCILLRRVNKFENLVVSYE